MDGSADLTFIITTATEIARYQPNACPVSMSSAIVHVGFRPGEPQLTLIQLEQHVGSKGAMHTNAALSWR